MLIFHNKVALTDIVTSHKRSCFSNKKDITDLGQLLSELIELLLQGGLRLLGLGHLGADAADGGVDTGAAHNTTGLA